jgi:23S rRNA (uracil747-C5)-methyltransferase
MAAFRPELVIINPPRRGLGEGTELLLNNLPEHILYSSCSIETLSADLKKMASHYQVKRVQLFDMFPHTSHFETLIWLERT